MQLDLNFTSQWRCRRWCRAEVGFRRIIAEPIIGVDTSWLNTAVASHRVYYKLIRHRDGNVISRWQLLNPRLTLQSSRVQIVVYVVVSNFIDRRPVETLQCSAVDTRRRRRPIFVQNVVTVASIDCRHWMKRCLCGTHRRTDVGRHLTLSSTMTITVARWTGDIMQCFFSISSISICLIASDSRKLVHSRSTSGFLLRYR